MLLYPQRMSFPPATPFINCQHIPNYSLKLRRFLAASASSDHSGSKSAQSSHIDLAAYEAERLQLDANARNSMAATASASDESSDSISWKWKIRKRIWDLMEVEDVARNPRPAHHRIPNFVGAPQAAESLGRLEVFRKAGCVKVNPDSPQKEVRFLTLADGKKLLTPQPRLRTGFFSVLESRMIPPGSLMEACSSFGFAKYGKPVGLDEKIKVDLLVVGSVAVDPLSGARLGKGECMISNWLMTSLWKSFLFMMFQWT